MNTTANNKCGEAQPIVSSQHYPNTESSKRFTKPTQKQQPAVEVNPVTPPSSGRKNPLKCRKCGCTVSKNTPKAGSLQGALRCARCGGHLKWLSKKDFTRLVDEGRMFPAQLTPGCPECQKMGGGAND